jgi:hypothetical protein
VSILMRDMIIQVSLIMLAALSTMTRTVFAAALTRILSKTSGRFLGEPSAGDIAADPSACRTTSTNRHSDSTKGASKTVQCGFAVKATDGCRVTWRELTGRVGASNV